MDNLEILFSHEDFINTSILFKDKLTSIDVTRSKTLDFSSPVIIAGPCAIESKVQLEEIAKDMKSKGVKVLRGGAFKPRTSPKSFQGLGLEGLKILREIGDRYDILVVTEAISTDTFDIVEQYSDIIQIGTRNMYNYPLLKKAGASSKPIILKRGLSATIKEFMYSAEYIITHGNKNVILCERGIRSFDNITRNCLDLTGVSLLKEYCTLPIIVDPSHACGHPKLIKPLSKASIAAGADGLMIEVHNKPEEALCDGFQSLTLKEFDNLIIEM